mgnify:CR=1 FL=1
MLYLVPTPIGNLKDFTFRAVETLQAVDFILCEDTRTSSKLLQHYQIQKPLTPFHQHNEHKIVEHLVQQLMAGKNIALITDAGTPGISDPAFLLVRACKAAGVPVTSLPGATAFVPALVNSGALNNVSINAYNSANASQKSAYNKQVTDSIAGGNQKLAQVASNAINNIGGT